MEEIHMTAHIPFRIGNPPTDQLFDTNLGLLTCAFDRFLADMNGAPIMEEADHD